MFVRLHSQTWQGCARPRGINYMHVQTDKERLSSIIWLLHIDRCLSVGTCRYVEENHPIGVSSQRFITRAWLREREDVQILRGRGGNLRQIWKVECWSFVSTSSTEWLCFGWSTYPGILVYVCPHTNIANQIFNSCSLHGWICIPSIGICLDYIPLYMYISWSVYRHMLSQL